MSLSCHVFTDAGMDDADIDTDMPDAGAGGDNKDAGEVDSDDEAEREVCLLCFMLGKASYSMVQCCAW